MKTTITGIESIDKALAQAPQAIRFGAIQGPHSCGLEKTMLAMAAANAESGKPSLYITTDAPLGGRVQKLTRPGSAPLYMASAATLVEIREHIEAWLRTTSVWDAHEGSSVYVNGVESVVLDVVNETLRMTRPRQVAECLLDLANAYGFTVWVSVHTTRPIKIGSVCGCGVNLYADIAFDLVPLQDPAVINRSNYSLLTCTKYRYGHKLPGHVLLAVRGTYA